MNGEVFLGSYAMHLNEHRSVLFPDDYSLVGFFRSFIMSRTFKIMTGAAGFAAVLTIASPAAAQQPYPYGNNGGGVVGAIINSVTGTNGQYPQGTYGYGQY